MKGLIPPAALCCFLLLASGFASGQQVQSASEPILIEYNGAPELVDPAILLELDPAGFKHDEKGQPYVVINGRKVIVNEPGVQSLIQPDAVMPRKEDPTAHPE